MPLWALKTLKTLMTLKTLPIKLWELRPEIHLRAVALTPEFNELNDTHYLFSAARIAGPAHLSNLLDIRHRLAALRTPRIAKDHCLYSRALCFVPRS